MPTLQRIQMRRTKGWKKPANTVYVGRPTKWGNPFKIGAAHPVTGKRMTQKDAVILHRDALTNPNSQISGELDPRCTLEAVKEELSGKNLACWCSLDEPCHADLLLELANKKAI